MTTDFHRQSSSGASLRCPVAWAGSCHAPGIPRALRVTVPCTTTRVLLHVWGLIEAIAQRLPSRQHMIGAPLATFTARACACERRATLPFHTRGAPSRGAGPAPGTRLAA